MACCWKLLVQKETTPTVWAKMISCGTVGGWSYGSQSFLAVRSQTKGLQWCCFFAIRVVREFGGNLGTPRHVMVRNYEQKVYLLHLSHLSRYFGHDLPVKSPKLLRSAMASSVFFRKAKAHGRATWFAHPLYTLTHTHSQQFVFIYIYIYVCVCHMCVMNNHGDTSW